MTKDGCIPMGGRCPRRSAPRSSAALLVVVAAAMAMPVPRASAQAAPPVTPRLLAPTLHDHAAYASAAAQERPRRQTRRGATIGAIVGAVSGLAVGSFIALLCRAESGPCDGAIPIVTVLGAASGAAAGAIIGAAIPADPAPAPTAETPRAPASPAGPPVDRRIGSASLVVGAARGRYEDVTVLVDSIPVFEQHRREGSGIAARANIYAELKPWLAIGPEAGIASVGGGERVRHAAVATRFTRPGERLSPYIGANIGAYQLMEQSLEFLGGGVSVGARWTPPGRRGFIDFDARFSGNVQNIEPMRMAGVYVGGGLYW